MTETLERCATCLGEGTIGSEYGLVPCTDCCGLGQLPPSYNLRERRLRELEETYSAEAELARDVRFLVHEVRTAQHALMQIMAAAMDVPTGDPLAARVRFLSNQALGLYPVTEADKQT